MNRVTAEGFDYQAEADKTNSIEWNPQYVHRRVFLDTLNDFAHKAEVLNLVKKMLFRGRTPEDLKLLRPSEIDSVEMCKINPKDIDLVHGLIGLVTEAGEIAELLIAVLEGRTPDRVNAVEECGDMRWYINRILRWANVTDEQCERLNIDKLHGRHGETFNVVRDADRDLAAERQRLEAGLDSAPTLPLGQAPPVAYGERDGPCGGCEGMDC